MPNELIPWRPDMPGIPPPGMQHVLAALSPGQDTQSDQLAAFYRPYPIPFVRHAPLPASAQSAHGAVAASSSQTLSARAVNAALPGIQRQNGPVTPQLAAQNVATLDNVPDSIAGGRTAWVTSAQKAAAVDINGNLLLKNIVSPTITTNGPTTTSTTYAVIPEMTSGTVKTNGNSIIVAFSMSCNLNMGVSSDLGEIAIFKDGVQLSTDYLYGNGHAGATIINGNQFVAVLTFIDKPAAGNHTYDVRWKVFNGGGNPTFACNGFARSFQLVELG